MKQSELIAEQLRRNLGFPPGDPTQSTLSRALVDPVSGAAAAYINRDGVLSGVGGVPLALAGDVVVYNSDGSSKAFRASSNTDAARGAALEAAWSYLTEGSLILIGPGLFSITARLPVDCNYITIRGAGMYNTTIKLLDIGAGASSGNVISNTNGDYETPRTGWTISDLTIDCNLAAQTSSITLGAINLQGSEMAIRRCRAIGWGAKSADECFVFVITGHYNTTLFDRNGLIEESIVDSPANVTFAGVVTAFDISGGGMSGAGITDPLTHGWFHGGTIRQCVVRDIVTGSLVGQPTTMQGFTCQVYGGVVEGCLFQNVTGTSYTALYADSWSAQGIVVAGNQFGGAILLSMSGNSVTDVSIVGNSVDDVAFVGNSTYKVQKVIVTGNRINGRVYLEQVNGALVCGNTITRSPTSDGVNVATGSSNVVQFGNYNDSGQVSGVNMLVSPTASGEAVFGGNVEVGVGAGTGSGVSIGNVAWIVNAGADCIKLWNSTFNGAPFVRFGGDTSAFPGLKRNGATIEDRIADDSDYAARQSLYERFGSGSPEGVITAPVGAVYHRTDGGAGTSNYFKESGSGSTGWVAK